MLKRLRFLSYTSSFLPDSVAAKLQSSTESKVELKPRHMIIICPPAGFPARVDWDLNNPESVEAAALLIGKLRMKEMRRAFFIETAPDEMGKRVRNPGTKENIIVTPEIYGG